jgi:MFS family permease
MVSLLVPALGTQGAGLAAGLSTAAAIAGRTLVGWLMPAGADRRVVASLSLLVQMAGCAALAAAGGESATLLLAGVVLVGFGIGNATSLPPLIAQAEFSKEQAARAVPLIVAASQAAYAFAPAAFGLVRSVAPDVAVFGLAALAQVAAVAAYGGGRRDRDRRRALVENAAIRADGPQPSGST